MESQKSLDSEAALREKIVPELSLPTLDFMSFYRATVTKIEQCWHKNVKVDQ